MKNIFLYSFLFCFISGCATTMYPPVRSGVKGDYHIVRDHETLWSIAKKHDVNIELLAELNRIPDIDRIEKGQRIFIPEKAIEDRSFVFKEEPVSYSKKATSGSERKHIKINKIYGEQFLWPAKGRLISVFGQKKDSSSNNGIDIQLPIGSNVKASRSGTVTFYSDAFRGYGKTLIIDHGNGYQTVYAYNSEIFPKEGDLVKQGQVIARSGKTGRAKEPSLHFEIRKKHVPVDPRKILK